MFVFSTFPVRLRKVKMDQRKLMDNANTITDMAKVRQQQQTEFIYRDILVSLLYDKLLIFPILFMLLYSTDTKFRL